MKIALSSSGRLAILCGFSFLIFSLAGILIQDPAEKARRRALHHRAFDVLRDKPGAVQNPGAAAWLIPEGSKGLAALDSAEDSAAAADQGTAEDQGAAAGAPVEYCRFPAAGDGRGLWLLILRGEGYGGDLWAAVLYNSQGEAMGGRLLVHQETAGYSRRVSDALVRGNHALDGVAGATVTADALSELEEAGSLWVQSREENRKGDADG